MENEKRLIDADALKSCLQNLEASGGHKYYRKGMDDTLHFHMPNIIDDQPTVDAVEVVRCKDCIHWKKAGSKVGNSIEDLQWIGGCKFTNCCRREIDFCSYGERRADG